MDEALFDVSYTSLANVGGYKEASNAACIQLTCFFCRMKRTRIFRALHEGTGMHHNNTRRKCLPPAQWQHDAPFTRLNPPPAAHLSTQLKMATAPNLTLDLRTPQLEPMPLLPLLRLLRRRRSLADGLHLLVAKNRCFPEPP